MFRYIIPFLLIAGLFLNSCKENKASEATSSVNVPVLTISRKNIVVDRMYVTSIQAVRNVEMRSKISGFLAAIYVDEGGSVKKDQLLFKIADEEFKSEVDRTRAVCNTAKAEAKSAEVEYNRVKMLVDKKVLSHTELELAESKLKVAQAKIEEAEHSFHYAEHRLSYTNIRAPFDGVIDRIPLKKGSLLSEGTLITTVSDINSMYAYFNISENEYLVYKRALGRDSGKEARIVELILSDGKDYDYKGKIETVVSEFEPGTGSIAFRAIFPNPKQLLKHKATGKVKLTQFLNDALIVPQKAAFEIQDKTYVFIVDSTNTVQTRSFVPAGRTDQFYVVQSGLNTGDRIVYEGIQNVKDGIKIIPSEMLKDTLNEIH